MATGRIQPGSRQWVEAMRRLSGTDDTTVDMSMGRKVSRDAAIPHGMGTATLDTRLRGGGQPTEITFEVVSTQLTGEAIFRVGGGRAPYVFDPRDGSETKVIPAPGEFTHTYNGPDEWSGGREAQVTDADDQTALIFVPFYVPIPTVWVPVSVALLEQGPVANGPFLMDAFDFFNRSAPGEQLLRGHGGSGPLWLADETGRVIIFANAPGIVLEVTFGTTERQIIYDRTTGISWGLEITSPVMLPGEMQPSSILQIVGTGSLRSVRMPASHGSHQNWPNLTVLNTVYGPLGQTSLWPPGQAISASGDPFGSTNKLAHWNGTAWADGASPAPLSQQVQEIIGSTVGFAVDPFDLSTVLTTGSIPASSPGQPVLRQNAKWGSAPGYFNGSGTRPVTGPQGVIYPVSPTANPTTNADAVMRGFFRNRSAIFICQAMQPPRRPAARAHAIACSQVNGALGRVSLHTDYDLSVTFNYRRTDLGDGADMVELPPGSLVPGQRSIITCEVDFAGGGARIWKNGVLGDSSTIPAAGGNLEDTLATRCRVGSFVAGGANEFFEGGLGRAVYLPFIPTAQQRAVIEAWVAEPAPVALATVADPTLTERVQAILRQTKGFALDPQDLTTLWQDDEATIPVTAIGQPVGAIRSKFGNVVMTYRAADPILTTCLDGAISFDGINGGFLNPADGATTSIVGAMMVARVAMTADQMDDAPVMAFLGVAGATRLALEVKSDLRPSFTFARPDSSERQIVGSAPLTAGQAHTLSLQASFVSTPAPIRGFVDGVLVVEEDLGAPPIATDVPVSPYGGIGQWGDTALQFSGYVGRVVYSHFTQTAKDRAALEAWVAVGPWPSTPPA